MTLSEKKECKVLFEVTGPPIATLKGTIIENMDIWFPKIWKKFTIFSKNTRRYYE